MNRRDFIKTTTVAAGAMTAVPWAASAADLPEPSASRLPRWRGFNLLEKFTDRRNAPFLERDFEWMAEWGFNFVRLPLSYWCWSGPDDWLKLDEARLKEIDQAVKYGKQHGIHVNINFHRAPGYCVNPPEEPGDLWTSSETLDAARHHWSHFAKRYRGHPNRNVSFDLLNEPARTETSNYVRVARALIEAIREEDPDRLIIADGMNYGREPVPELTEQNVGQSTRGYDPFTLTHYQAGWVSGSDRWPVPAWPLNPDGSDTWDRERLKRERIAPWKKLESQGSGVHVGEWGVYNKTPHSVTLKWMEDVLSIWKEAGWGWSLWNFRGSFGPLDSGRSDVQYEPFRGHRLDRRMLELLREY